MVVVVFVGYTSSWSGGPHGHCTASKYVNGGCQHVGSLGELDEQTDLGGRHRLRFVSLSSF